MAYDEQLADRVRTYFGKRKVAFAQKPMMGGLCLLVDDKMCVGIKNDRLMVRLDPDVYEEALGRKGCIPLEMSGRPMRGFVFVKTTALVSEGELASWLDLALEFNPRAKSSKSKPKNSKPNSARAARLKKSLKP